MSTASISAPVLSPVGAAAITRRSVYFNGTDVEIISETLPALKPNEVRVRSEATLISIGTEIAWIEQLAKDGAGTHLGYSHTGVIEAVGADVSGYKVGDRVLSCSSHSSHTNVTVAPGALDLIPLNLASEHAAFTLLASIAYHIVQRGAPKLSEPTAVIGQGVVGSLIMQSAKLCGAEPLIAIDVDAGRLKTAERLGAIPVNAATEDVAERVKQITGGAGVSLVIEAATNPAAFEMAFKILSLRGRLVVTSTVFGNAPFPVLDGFIEKELTVIGAHQPKVPLAPNAFYPFTQSSNRVACMKAMAAGRLRVDHLLSHTIRVEEAPAIYQRLRAKDRSIIGAVIDWR
jgi:threonine dehydrogenase-like Zn-dependent dehydrogenase